MRARAQLNCATKHSAFLPTQKVQTVAHVTVWERASCQQSLLCKTKQALTLRLPPRPHSDGNTANFGTHTRTGDRAAFAPLSTISSAVRPAIQKFLACSGIYIISRTCTTPGSRSRKYFLLPLRRIVRRSPDRDLAMPTATRRPSHRLAIVERGRTHQRSSRSAKALANSCSRRPR